MSANGGGSAWSGARAILRDRAVQGLLAVILWWAVYYRAGTIYGQGGGIVAATCAAWAYVLVSSYATFVLNRRAARNGGPRNPPPRGRWPGAPP
jgi:hypothetical protein